MHKLLALYQTPADSEAFLARYREQHLPLAAKLPGLVRSEVTLIQRTMMGEVGSFLLAEMYFADSDSFKAAMRSPENAALGADLMDFAKDLVTVMSGVVADW
jgi:uncharacterized protein (TIGR02118 family)